jgi:hypothetical protein
MLIGAYFLGELEDFTSTNPGIVLWIDTEQAPPHCAMTYKRVNLMRGNDDLTVQRDLIMLMFREYDSKTRFNLTFQAIERFKPDLVIIDGVADLIQLNNDEGSAVLLQDTLLNKSKLFNCHILSVIHSNEGTEKARGHTGANLTRKCETIMTLTSYDEKTKVTFKTRDREPKPIAFAIDMNSLPYLCDSPEARTIDYVKMYKQIIKPREALAFTELVKRIMEYRSAAGSPVSERYTKLVIAEHVKKGLIFKSATGYQLFKPKVRKEEKNFEE